MIIDGNFITEATEDELYNFYLDNGYDNDVMSFDEFIDMYIKRGVNIIYEEEE